ncbi:serine/threonine-protein kinase [Streptomyces sp. NPDC058739]|uniref:serine/threonine-protein kinase n=1 Tax=Streptomyces sp. NPDC058739 TaxID=3346618 RepID=UPI00369216F1
MEDASQVFRSLEADDPAVVGGYRLAARLGAGGMGRVYLSHTQGGRPVAIKVVRPELADDPDFRRRFSREVAAARRVRGAYTAELIDADSDGVPPWLVTLYVPGPSLAEAVGRGGPLPVPAVLWLMAGVAEALQAIHAEGIVHRDLKPSNVLLAADGPRVIDFGISLAAGLSSHTATGAAVGTPHFMAPEQATAGEVTAATDVFALGQTAAFAALGEPLYGSGSAPGVLYRIVHEQPDLSRLPEPLRPLIARCLAPDPRERATLAEVLGWCREQLGADADAGAGPAVWREVAGRPDMALQAPVPAPTLRLPRPPWFRGRRAAMVSAAAVTAAALLTTGLAWVTSDAGAGFRDWVAGASPAHGPEESVRPSATSSGASATGDDDRPGTPQAPTPSRIASGASGAVAYTSLYLDAKKSLSFGEPVQRQDREGDIRFDCEEVGCSLDSDSSVFVQVFGDKAASREVCGFLLSGTGSDYRHWPLAAAANGSQICVRHSSGDIALLVIRTKSTALPELAFMQVEMTVWRKAA